MYSYQEVVDLIRNQKNHEIEKIGNRESFAFFNDCSKIEFDEKKELERLKSYKNACDIANEVIEEVLINLENGSHLAG